MRCVNERERAICYGKKQIDIRLSYVCAGIDNEFRHNIVKIVCQSTQLSPRGSTVTVTVVVIVTELPLQPQSQGNVWCAVKKGSFRLENVCVFSFLESSVRVYIFCRRVSKSSEGRKVEERTTLSSWLRTNLAKRVMTFISKLFEH